MAAKYDLDIDQGATFQRILTWQDGDGVPIDLTGYSARMQIRKTRTDNDILIEATTANGRIALGGAAGTITITLDAALTASLTWWRGVYDLELESVGGQVTRLLEGSVYVSREVTR